MGTKISYKYSLGDWSRVEKDRFGFETENRSLTASNDIDVQDEIYNWSEGAAYEKRITGKVISNIVFYSEEMNETIGLSIYLPPDYNEDANIKYPVIYVIGGNNAFTTTYESPEYQEEWQFDEISEILIKSGKCRKFIIAAVNNIKNTNYFLVNRNKDLYSDIYFNLIISQIKPFIDANYRSLIDKKNSLIFSAGIQAAAVLNSISEISRVFGNFVFLSPEISIASEKITERLNIISQDTGIPAKCWWESSASGYFEKNSTVKYINSAYDGRRISDILKKKNILDQKTIHYSEIDGDFHNVTAWSRRIDRILLFFFKK